MGKSTINGKIHIGEPLSTHRKKCPKQPEVQPSAAAGSGQRPAPGAEGRGFWLGPAAQEKPVQLGKNPRKSRGEMEKPGKTPWKTRGKTVKIP